ncbi:reverse transcriptase domain-containing protein [Tanacetum coccineum]
MCNNNNQGPPLAGPNQPAPDLRPMEELLQAPTDDVGFENDDPHSHIRRTTNLQNDITNFQQKFNETFSEAWERFKDMLKKCPHHGFSPLHKIDTFYNGLNQSDQDSLNSATVEALGKHILDMQTLVHSIQKSCETCGGPHPYYECQVVGGYTQGDVYATTGNYNAGGNSYQPQGNRNLLSYHSNNYLGPPDFNQANNSNQIKTFKTEINRIRIRIDLIKGYYQNQGQNVNQNQAPNQPSMDDLLRQLLDQNQNLKRDQEATNKALNERPQGVLPSNIVPNPREQINSITTRSGLTTTEPFIPPPVPPTPREEVEKEPETLMDEVHITSPASTAHVPPPGIQPVSPPKPKEDPKPNPHQPKIPYPSRLDKTKLLDKNDVQISKFIKILKQLHFDISLMDALTQIPKYSKVLRDLLKDKEKLEELANTLINVECSAILLNKVPEKLRDPGKFLIPCVLQDLEVCNSLADSGAKHKPYASFDL